MMRSAFSQMFPRIHRMSPLFALAALASAPGCMAEGPVETPALGFQDDSEIDSEEMALTMKHQGEGTFYAKTSDGGHCSYGRVSTTLFGAMNHAEYANSTACGVCARIRGPNGEVTVKIVDECPECKVGDIDLSEEAFSKLAPMSRGRIPITWGYIRCNVSGPIVYHFKEGSNQWWTAVQIRNAPRRVYKLEAKTNGQFVVLRRESYNYFIADSGLGAGPYAFRVTDALGNVITDTGVSFRPDSDVPSPSNRQFP